MKYVLQRQFPNSGDQVQWQTWNRNTAQFGFASSEDALPRNNPYAFETSTEAWKAFDGLLDATAGDDFHKRRKAKAHMRVIGIEHELVRTEAEEG